ncbi:LysR family transcriptional regulator [Candidatus Gracilibacteria bacterium]|nr:LysR family transcriptional regulator [Candidatus Gracilibacteria bacterium]NJM89173.1 LysR family transcriptional regulator [Hydrococcus sp. RU_2_2]
MELQHFRCFVVLAEELHFTRASERLHLSQPHLSRIVNQIEKQLGATLIRRTTRQVTLTDAGKKFFTEAKSVLNRVEEAMQAMQQFAEAETERLTIGFTEMARHYVVPKILSAFCDRHPQIQLDILESCTEELVESLNKAEIDIAFLHPPLRANFLEMLPLGQESFAIALPIDHPLASQKEIQFADLANETFILHYRECGPVLYDRILQLCQKAGFSAKVVHQDAKKSFLGFVTAKMGVCLMTSSMQNVKNPGIICLPIAGEAPTLEYAAAWRHDNTSTSVATLVEVLRNC